jgi:hypothetical protein
LDFTFGHVFLLVVVVVIIVVQVHHGADVHVQYEIFFAWQNEPQTIFLFRWTDRQFAYVWQWGSFFSKEFPIWGLNFLNWCFS